MTSPTHPPSSLPLAHLIVPTSPVRRSAFSFPLTPVTITTFNEHLADDSHDHNDTTHDPSLNSHNHIPPPRPPRSPRRTPPKRLDATPERRTHTPSLSLSSLEYVRTALRVFRSTLSPYRFPDKSPIRSPSRKYHRTCSPSADPSRHQKARMSAEPLTAQRLADELRSKLAGSTYERYGPVKAVTRDGIGGHWRSYSTPPPASGMGLAVGGVQDDELREGRRVSSETSDRPAPLRPRGGLPDFAHTPPSSRRASAPPLPTLHVIHPSISTTPDDPSIYPPTRNPEHGLHHTHGHVEEDSVSKFAAVVDMMDAGQASRSEQSEQGADAEDAVYMSQRSAGGRSQTTRRNRLGPGGIISKVASKSSLSKLRIAFAPPTSHSDDHLHPNGHPSRLSQRQPSPSPSAKRNSAASYISHRPAPAPPLLLNPTPNRFAPSSARIPSPSPSATPAPSRAPTPLSLQEYKIGGVLANGVSPGRSSVWGQEEGMVEIPRFKKRELNLGIVAGGMGQRIAWGVLWLGWLISGLISIFFDVNVLYMLVQCAQNSSAAPDSASARTWVFAVAAYATCWIISVFAVWIGWELCFEYWRRWRMPRPAIEPIHTSLPASLHLSLTSFQHFTFFIYVRLSPRRTPHASDIIPETAHLVIQTLPGLAPILPRASLAIVLLVAYSSADATTSARDSAFWVPNTGRLTAYARGVLLAFVAFTAFRLLLVILSALALWAFSRPRRPIPSRFRSRFDSFSTTSPTNTRPSTPDAPTAARDPADTQSPSKGWTAESDLKWEWRERARNRLQDAFELCMIRRPRSSAGTSSVQRSGSGWQGSPSRQGGQSLPLGPLGSGEAKEEDKENEEVLSPTSADPFMRLDPSRSRSTIRFAAPPPSLSRQDTDDTTRPPPAQARPESELEPIPRTPTQPSRTPVPSAPEGTARQSSTASLDPRSALGTLPTARQSASSQDLFYTPLSRTPATERTSSRSELRGKASDSDSDPASRAAGVLVSPIPTPPSAYRRPVGPGPGPSTAGTSLTTVHALSNAPGQERAESVEHQAGSEQAVQAADGGDAGTRQALSPIPDNRNSSETTSGESITDDSAALLSRSSSHSDHGPHVHPAHHQTSTASLRRASQIFRERSQSLVSRLRDRSGSLSGAAGAVSDHGHASSASASRRGSYATLMDGQADGDVSEFGMKGEGAQAVLRRNRSTSVGMLREATKGSLRKAESGAMMNEGQVGEREAR